MSSLFLDIDTQIDFTRADGNLYIPDAESIIAAIKKMTRIAKKKNILIFSSVDNHTIDDPEFKKFNFPAHCVKGTNGQKKIPESLLEKHIFIKNLDEEINLEKLFEKYQQIIFEKTSFSIFDNPKFYKAVEIINPDQIFVYGVATDFCVKAAIEEFLNKGYKNIIYLVTDAIKGINEENVTKILEGFEEKGVKMITVEEILDFTHSGTSKF